MISTRIKIHLRKTIWKATADIQKHRLSLDPLIENISRELNIQKRRRQLVQGISIDEEIALLDDIAGSLTSALEHLGHAKHALDHIEQRTTEVENHD